MGCSSPIAGTFSAWADRAGLSCSPMRPAVFLDRDDTLVDTRGATADSAAPGDLFEPELVRILPGVPEALARLHQAGFLLPVISNQGAVARGRCGTADVEAVNDRIRCLLAAAGVPIGPFYYCPFHPAGIVPAFAFEHPWRKPAPGMIQAAVLELGIHLEGSWAIGDAPRDLAAAVGAGLRPDRAILIGTSPTVDVRCAGLAAAADMVLAARAEGAS